MHCLSYSEAYCVIDNCGIYRISWVIKDSCHTIHMQQYYLGIKFDKCTTWENSPTVHLSNVCIEKYSSTVSSQTLPWLASWSCFNFWLVSLMSKHCVARNMSQKEAFSSSPSSFKLLCISDHLPCLSVRADAAGAVLFMSCFSCVSTTKQSIKKGKINHRICQSSEGGEKSLGKLMNLFSLPQLWMLWTWQKKKYVYTILLYVCLWFPSPPPPSPSHTLCVVVH